MFQNHSHDRTEMIVVGFLLVALYKLLKQQLLDWDVHMNSVMRIMKLLLEYWNIRYKELNNFYLLIPCKGLQQ